ncbi:hypothetical protein [Rugamonas rubra]|uniref:hypothetical protein n=1 Tax=Rugamonas rubra TaxID=758825 RepID=UPI000B86FF8B|nr:hypothetical protein [Rugamonas rubra]
MLSDEPLHADLKSGVFLLAATAEIAADTLQKYLDEALQFRGAEVVRIIDIKLSRLLDKNAGISSERSR